VLILGTSRRRKLPEAYKSDFLNDAIDLTPGGAELWFDPRQGSDRVFLRALDEFATKSAMRKSLRSLGVSGDTLVAGYGPM